LKKPNSRGQKVIFERKNEGMHLTKDLIQCLCEYSENKNLFFTCKHYYAYITLFYKKYPMKITVTAIPIKKFPRFLHTLTFGDCFDQDVSQLTLPQGLHTLTFGCCFDRDVSQLTLPESLRTLAPGNRFDRDVSQLTLPRGLHTLIVGRWFDQDVSQLALPTNCKIIRK